jgi:prepilin peptidase CpaA
MAIGSHAYIVAGTLGFLALCIASDLRTLRIPNAVTGPAILLGMAANTWLLGARGFFDSMEGLGVGIGILLLPFALGGIGGGDVKMMGAVGALLGPRLVFQSLVVGLVLGGVIAVVRLAVMARLTEKLTATARMFANALLSRSIAPLRLSSTSPDAVVLPYSVPLGVGTASVIAISVFGAL